MEEVEQVCLNQLHLEFDVFKDSEMTCAQDEKKLKTAFN